MYTITYSGVAAVGNGNQIHTYVYINGVAVPGTETRTQAYSTCSRTVVSEEGWQLYVLYDDTFFLPNALEDWI